MIILVILDNRLIDITLLLGLLLLFFLLSFLEFGDKY
jgi:hypothetical protein